MKLDENYTLIGDESQWTLYYEKKYFDEKKKKEVVSKNSYYFNKMSDAINSYIDKKLKEKETVYKVIEELKKKNKKDKPLSYGNNSGNSYILNNR